MDEDDDEEKTKVAVATAFGLASVFKNRRLTDTFRRQPSEKEKLQLDIAALRKQYAKLRERQRQAHVIWSAATSSSASVLANVSTAGNSMSHLLAGRKPLLVRRPSTSSKSSAPRLPLPPPRTTNANSKVT